jgi:hypothetical protein
MVHTNRTIHTPSWSDEDDEGDHLDFFKNIFPNV